MNIRMTISIKNLRKLHGHLSTISLSVQKPTINKLKTKYFLNILEVALLVKYREEGKRNKRDPSCFFLAFLGIKVMLSFDSTHVYMQILLLSVITFYKS